MWKYKFNPLSWEFDLVGGSLNWISSLDGKKELDGSEVLVINDSSWTAQKVTVDQLVDQTIPAIYNNSYFKKWPNHRLRILCYGSSWFSCNWLYLNKILANLWIKSEIHWYYMWHSQFDEWIKLYNWDYSPISWSERTRWTVVYKSIDWAERDKYVANMSWTTYADKIDITIQEFADMWRDDVINGDWDIVILQQWAHQTCKPQYWANQEEYVKFLKASVNPDTIIWFNSTWAPGTNWTWINVDANTPNTPNTVAWQHTFMQDHFDRVKDFMAQTWIYNISPSWVVLQMIREYTDWASSNGDLTKDTLHPTNWLPCFAINAALYQSIIAPLTWIPIKNNTWLPDTDTVRTAFSNWSSYYQAITDAQAQKIYQYIDAAIAWRFDIIPDEPSVTTWRWNIDATSWWVVWLSLDNWVFANSRASNTLLVSPNPWYSIKSIKQNWENITVDGNVYTVWMTFGSNLFEVEFEQTSTPWTTYTITTSVANWTYVSPTSTDASGTSVLIKPNSNAVLPNSITVSWASYTYDSATWVVVLSSVTGNVTISATCLAPQEIVYNTSNVYMLVAPEEAWSSTTIQFEPDTIAYDYPSTVSVTWATLSSYDSSTWTIVITNPTTTVEVTINAPVKTLTEDTPLSINKWYLDWAIDWSAWHYATITLERYFLPFTDSWSTRMYYWEYVNNYRWTNKTWLRALLFVPAGKRITVHSTDDYCYSAFVWKFDVAPQRTSSSSTQPEYWEWTLNANGYDVSWIMNWTDTVTMTRKENNPYRDNWTTFADYFKWNKNNDFVYDNNTDAPVYVWIWYAIQSGTLNKDNISVTYTISTPVTRSITTSISWWTLLQNPTSMLNDWTATIVFKPKHLFNQYPSSVTVNCATSCYDCTTWTITLTCPTDDVTVCIDAPHTTVTTWTPIELHTCDFASGNCVTTTITWVRHIFVSWADPNSTRVSLANCVTDKTEADWDYAAWLCPRLWVPNGYSITLHTDDANCCTNYMYYAHNQERVPWRINPRPSCVKWWGAVNINGIDLTCCWTNTFFGKTDDYCCTMSSPYNASTFAAYFPYNVNNDAVFCNNTWEDLYIWIVWAWKASSCPYCAQCVSMTYQYDCLPSCPDT